MKEIKLTAILYFLISIVILLMISIIGLFIRVNSLQQQIINIFTPIESQNKVVGLEIGDLAPDFALNNTLGALVANSDYLGENLLLVFYSPTCPICIEMLPNIVKVGELFPKLNILLISNDNIENNLRMKQDKSLIFPVLEWNDTVASKYYVTGTPYFYFIGPDGRIIEHGHATSLQRLQEIVKMDTP